MSERRTRLLLVLVLAGQLVFLTQQAPEAASGGTPLERAGVRALAPVARAVDAGFESAAGVRGRLRRRADLERENLALREEVERLRIEALRRHELEEEARRLAGALDYARRGEERLHLVDVVYIDHASWLRTLVVYGGRTVLRVDQPLVASSGLIGRVVLVSGPYAKVQLVTDRAAAVGAMLERSRRQGVVRGDGQGGLEMDFVPLQAEVAVGEKVVTAGIDGVYPRGLAVGTVVAVEPGSELFHRIRLAPAVDFGRLGEAYALERAPVPAPLREASADAPR